jgi:ketopantoate hydroxymethyltransferase
MGPPLQVAAAVLAVAEQVVGEIERVVEVEAGADHQGDRAAGIDLKIGVFKHIGAGPGHPGQVLGFEARGRGEALIETGGAAQKAGVLCFTPTALRGAETG